MIRQPWNSWREKRYGSFLISTQLNIFFFCEAFHTTEHSRPKSSVTVYSIFMAATSAFEPDPHRETAWIACVKVMSRGCTRSRLRI